MTQVHKETLETIDNAIPGRESVDIEIFGMEGIPEPELIQHRNRIMAQFQQDEQDRRVQAGLPGTSKKPKIEKLDPEEIKRRLAEHKKMLAEGQLKQQQQGHVPEGQSPIGGAQSPALNGVVQGSPPPQNFYVSLPNPLFLQLNLTPYLVSTSYWSCSLSTRLFATTSVIAGLSGTTRNAAV